MSSITPRPNPSASDLYQFFAAEDNATAQSIASLVAIIARLCDEIKTLKEAAAANKPLHKARKMARVLHEGSPASARNNNEESYE